MLQRQPRKDRREDRSLCAPPPLLDRRPRNLRQARQSIYAVFYEYASTTVQYYSTATIQMQYYSSTATVQVLLQYCYTGTTVLLRYSITVAVL